MCSLYSEEMVTMLVFKVVVVSLVVVDITAGMKFGFQIFLFFLMRKE